MNGPAEPTDASTIRPRSMCSPSRASVIVITRSMRWAREASAGLLPSWLFFHSRIAATNTAASPSALSSARFL